MKKMNYLFVAVAATAMMLTSCKKKTEEPAVQPEVKQQNAVAIYFGGSWCGPCGAYGKPTKESMHNTFGDKAVIISCQVNGAGGQNDPMNNADANAFAAGFGISSVPIMYVGGHNELIQGIGSSNTMTTTATNTTNTLIAKTAIASTSADIKVNGSTVTIDTKTKFFENQTEEYTLAVYLTENGLVYTQTSDASTNKNIHDHVLRKKLSATVFGDVLASNLKSGDVKEKSFTTTLDAAWKPANMDVVLILWRKGSDGKYTICNGTVKKMQ